MADARHHSTGPAAALSLEGALTALGPCLLAGAVLALFFDPQHAYRTIAGWLLGQPAAALARNLHYWSAQALLVLGLLLAWRQLRLAAPGAVRSARTVLLTAVLLAAMLSGFLLRGDGDAREVERLIAGALAALPIPVRTAGAFRSGASAMHVYAVHLGTAAILTALLILELRRGCRPRLRRVVAWIAPLFMLSLVVSPGLHDGLDPTFRGPWFFLPLQSLLQYAPGAAVAAVAAAVLALWAIPKLPGRWRGYAGRAVAAVATAYLGLCASAVFLNGDGGMSPRWPDRRSDPQWGWILRAVPPQSSRLAAAVVRGRPEGCRACHAEVGGFDRSHRPDALGCASCHGGDPFTLDGKRAHRELLRVPGNLADARRTCGQAGCHLAIAPRVERSIMSTMAGVITADRRVLGEPVDSAAAPPNANLLGHSVADSHLRELCISCHLGQPKTGWGAIGQESRGGGCNACHLVYGKEAAAELARYLAIAPEQRRAIPRTHPGLTVNPGDDHCFGCHSRSSRISTSYEGWHELNRAPRAGTDPARLRTFEDGRVFERVLPDVHHERGLGCIDCHVSSEVMGSGVPVARKSEQVRIACTDCHARRLASIDPAALDPEARTLLALRGWVTTPSQRLGAARSGDALVNVFVDAAGRGELRRKRDGATLLLAPPLPVCTGDRGHARLTCTTCHSAWASRCAACHTEFDPDDVGYDNLDHAWVKGTWNESAGPFQVAPPTLGVLARRGADGREGSRIETFVPGMIMTFDRNRDPRRPPDVIFRRLYGLTFAHTIRRETRSCRSCHSDPIALGYGSGTLRYEIEGGAGRWRFEPRQPRSPHDGLPADAWIGFLQTRTGMVSARDDVRPFSVDEQKRILRVGACLTCHAGTSDVMQRALSDFDTALAQRSRRCVLPAW